MDHLLLLHCILAATLLGGVSWLGCRRRAFSPPGRMRTGEGQYLWFRHGVLPALALSLVLAGGWGGPTVSATEAETAQRQELLDQVCGIASAVGTESARQALVHAQRYGTARVSRDFIPISQPTPTCCGCNVSTTHACATKRSSLGHKATGREISGPSPRGTVWAHPPAELAEALHRGEATSTGPYNTEHGTCISAFAPLPDPATGQVRLVVGADLPAATVRDAVHSAWRLPILRTGGMLVLLCVGRVPPAQAGRTVGTLT